jgi:hypothetical protein
MSLLAKTFNPVTSEEMQTVYSKIFFEGDSAVEIAWKGRILRGMHKGYFRSDYVYLIVSNWLTLFCAPQLAHLFAIN